MMPNTEINKYTDADGRTQIASVIYWKNTRKRAHCLAQVAILPNKKVIIFLADLRTSSRYISLCDDLALIAETVWSNLSNLLPNELKSATRWYYRSGSHSSYDSFGMHELTEILLSLDKDQNWIEDGLGTSLQPEEEKALLNETNMESVEISLSKLPKLPELDPDDH